MKWERVEYTDDMPSQKLNRLFRDEYYKSENLKLSSCHTKQTAFQTSQQANKATTTNIIK